MIRSERLPQKKQYSPPQPQATAVTLLTGCCGWSVFTCVYCVCVTALSGCPHTTWKWTLTTPSYFSFHDLTITINNSIAAPSQTARNLGVTLDSQLSIYRQHCSTAQHQENTSPSHSEGSTGSGPGSCLLTTRLLQLPPGWYLLDSCYSGFVPLCGRVNYHLLPLPPTLHTENSSTSMWLRRCVASLPVFGNTCTIWEKCCAVFVGAVRKAWFHFCWMIGNTNLFLRYNRPHQWW